jgi:hypothetical protein
MNQSVSNIILLTYMGVALLFSAIASLACFMHGVPDMGYRLAVTAGAHGILFGLAKYWISKRPAYYFMCLLNEVITGHDVNELIRFVMSRFPTAVRRKATGKHETMPWEIDSVFVVSCESSVDPDGERTVAYLWRAA